MTMSTAFISCMHTQGAHSPISFSELQLMLITVLLHPSTAHMDFVEMWFHRLYWSTHYLHIIINDRRMRPWKKLEFVGCESALKSRLGIETVGVETVSPPEHSWLLICSQKEKEKERFLFPNSLSLPVYYFYLCPMLCVYQHFLVILLLNSRSFISILPFWGRARPFSGQHLWKKISVYGFACLQADGKRSR